MWSGIITTVLTAAMREFLTRLFESLFGFVDKQKQDAAREELGEAKVIAKINQGAADAERRAAEAAAKAGKF
jgi:hypothetical protein